MSVKFKLLENRIFKFSIFSAGTLLLLLFSILILLKNKTFESVNYFTLAMPYENMYEDICGCSLEKILSFTNFKTHNLTTNFNEKQSQYKLIQNDIRNIVTQKDGQNGIHIKLSKETVYQDVVRVLDICKIENAPTYILKDFDIWIISGANPERSKQCK